MREKTLEGGRRHRGVTASDYPDSTSPHGVCRAWMHVDADRSDHLPFCSWRSCCRATQHRPSCSVSVPYLGTWKQGADCASLIETNEPRACGTARGPRRLGCPCRASNEQIVCGSYSTLPRSRRYDRTASVRTPANVRLLGSAVAEGCHRGWPATIEQPAPSSDF